MKTFEDETVEELIKLRGYLLRPPPGRGMGRYRPTDEAWEKARADFETHKNAMRRLEARGTMPFAACMELDRMTK